MQSAAAYSFKKSDKMHSLRKKSDTDCQNMNINETDDSNDNGPNKVYLSFDARNMKEDDVLLVKFDANLLRWRSLSDSG